MIIFSINMTSRDHLSPSTNISPLISITDIIRTRKKRKLIKCKKLKYKYQSFIIPRDTKHYYSSSEQVFIDWCPYSICSTIEDSVELNLFINSKFDYYTWYFMKKEPYQITQRFNPKSEMVDINVKKTLDIIICGIVRRFERDHHKIIPHSIAFEIRACIEVGAADFYCVGFNNPRFNTYPDPFHTPDDPNITPEDPNISPNIPDAWYGI